MFPPVRGYPRAMARLATVAIVAVCVLIGPPGAGAFAHGGAAPIPDAAYYRTGFSDVAPTPPGITVRVDPAGEWLELTNKGPALVLVLGYSREPYLRITSTVVEENQLSPTTYLNRSLFADAVPSGQDSTTVAPVWKQIGTGGAVRWHDHRIHWMGQARPPVVDADPSQPHTIGTWTVHATADDVPFDIHGDLQWIGKPGGWLQGVPGWVLYVGDSLVLIIAILGVLLWRQRRAHRIRTGHDAIPTPIA
jgi:hypothetical protein